MSEEKTHTGSITVSGRGVGYFTVEGIEEDIEIQTPLLKTALNNDEVEVKLQTAQEGLRQQGEVVRIVKRAKMQFVGTLIGSKDFYKRFVTIFSTTRV